MIRWASRDGDEQKIQIGSRFPHNPDEFAFDTIVNDNVACMNMTIPVALEVCERLLAICEEHPNDQ